MSTEYEPATRWARRVVSIDQEIDELNRKIHGLRQQRVDAIQSGRCPERPDSAGARCTDDAGHEARCSYHPERDMPEPFTLVGMTWWQDDRWDVQ